MIGLPIESRRASIFLVGSTTLIDARRSPLKPTRRSMPRVSESPSHIFAIASLWLSACASAPLIIKTLSAVRSVPSAIPPGETRVITFWPSAVEPNPNPNDSSLEVRESWIIDSCGCPAGTDTIALPTESRLLSTFAFGSTVVIEPRRTASPWVTRRSIDRLRSILSHIVSMASAWVSSAAFLPLIIEIMSPV